MSETFCPIPWNFQGVRSNGDIRICCQANISQSQGVLRKQDGTTFNAKDGQLDLARNSQILKDVRKNMLRGVWSPSCTRCQQEEASQLNSRRKYEQEQWSLRFEDVVKNTEEDGSIDVAKYPVRYLDLRFGNLCNLKCRMCGPTDSSAWYEDWVELTGSTKFKDTSGEVQLKKEGGRFTSVEYDWHFSETFWQEIESRLDQIQHIYMAGGEPLLIKRHYDFLSTCVQRGYAKNIILEYNTNCTKLPPKVLELWTHFKNVRVGASIDGHGVFAEYQRYPSQWSEVYDNLKLLNAQPPNVLTWLAFTVTAYNIFHMVDFMKWKLKNLDLKNINRTARRPIITPHVAHNPKHLNIRVLPQELKQELTSQFEEFLVWIEQNNFEKSVLDQAQQIKASVTQYMNGANYHPSHWSEFCSYTSKLDQMRGQNVFDLVPQFRPFFAELV